MAGDMELMKELRRIKSGKGEIDELPETVDGVTGEREVADQFRKVYQTLYTSAASEKGMDDLQQKLRLLLQTENSETEVEKVTADIVKQDVTKMKKHKMDISQGFSSDALLHARTCFSSCLPSSSRTGSYMAPSRSPSSRVPSYLF